MNEVRRGALGLLRSVVALCGSMASVCCAQSNADASLADIERALDLTRQAHHSCCFRVVPGSVSILQRGFTGDGKTPLIKGEYKSYNVDFGPKYAHNDTYLARLRDGKIFCIHLERGNANEAPCQVVPRDEKSAESLRWSNQRTFVRDRMARGHERMLFYLNCRISGRANGESCKVNEGVNALGTAAEEFKSAAELPFATASEKKSALEEASKAEKEKARFCREYRCDR